MNPCFVKEISKNDYFFSCQIKPSNLNPQGGLFTSFEFESRPRYCNDSERAKIDDVVKCWKQQHMDRCLYEYHYMSRCGSKELDPQKYPEIWNKYINSIEKIFLKKINKQREINFICFTAGLLLLDAQLIKYLFNLNQFRKWKGSVNFDFIDYRYKINEKVEPKVERTVEKNYGDINEFLGRTAVSYLGDEFYKHFIQDNSSKESVWDDLKRALCVEVGAVSGAHAGSSIKSLMERKNEEQFGSKVERTEKNYEAVGEAVGGFAGRYLGGEFYKNFIQDNSSKGSIWDDLKRALCVQVGAAAGAHFGANIGSSIMEKTEEQVNINREVEEVTPGFKEIESKIAIPAFTEAISQVLYDNNKEVKVTTSFFYRTDEYAAAEKRSIDIMLGYDIGNNGSLKDFNSLRNAKIKDDGQAIVVLKEDYLKQYVLPIFSEAKGKGGFKKICLWKKQWMPLEQFKRNFFQ